MTAQWEQQPCPLNQPRTLTLNRQSPNPRASMRRPTSFTRSLLPNTMARRQPAFLNVSPGPSLRASSAPPSGPRKASLHLPPSSTGHPSLEPHRYQTDPPPSPSANGPSATSLDLMNSLQRSEGAVVKTRSGSVLSRGFILKTDHYPSGAHLTLDVHLSSTHNLSGRALDLDLNVHGAPNFRAPRVGDLNVFGVAQPRTQGLRAILSILRCRPNTPNPSHVVWFSTREEPIGEPLSRPESCPRPMLSIQSIYPAVPLYFETLQNPVAPSTSLIAQKTSRPLKRG